MKPCRECRREVSEQALACPGCGAPHPAREKRDGYGFEYRSKLAIAGLPLLHVSSVRRTLRTVVALAAIAAAPNLACTPGCLPAGWLPGAKVKGFVQGSASMQPTLVIGDWILVSMGEQPSVGDVVVYEAPARPAGAGNDPLSKRVIARGGDRISIRDGVVRLNGRALSYRPCTPPEPPAKVMTAVLDVECAVEQTEGGKQYRVIRTRGGPAVDFSEVLVPPEHVFVLGDFRDHSADSRVHGPIPASSVLGVAKRIYNSSDAKRVGRQL